MQHIQARKLSELLDEVYDCVANPPHWNMVLRKVCDELDLISGVLGCYVRSEGTPLLRIQHGVSPAFFDRMPEYGAEMGSFWGGFERIHSFPIGELTLHSVVQPDYDPAGNRFAREWCEPQGICDFAAMTLANDSDTLSSLVFGSSRLLERDGQSELELLRLLSPHIRRALGISRLLDLKSIELRNLTSALEALPNGLVLLDTAAKVVFANAAADAMVRGNDSLRVSDGRLTLTDPAASGALASVLADLANGSVLSERGSGIPLRGANGTSRMLHVLPLNHGSMRHALDARAVAAIFVVSELTQASLPQDALRLLYDLTPAEVRVCELLVDGFTPAEIAGRIGVAPSTAKSHLLRIFEKTGTGRQAELVRLVTSLKIARRPTSVVVGQ